MARFDNGVRLHESIGYVTPLDEQEGRGLVLRKAGRSAVGPRTGEHLMIGWTEGDPLEGVLRRAGVVPGAANGLPRT